jgi:hypothetical protein
MSRPTPTINHDFDKLIEHARLQRNAAIGTMLVDAAVAIGKGVKRVFGSAHPRNAAVGARHA